MKLIPVLSLFLAAILMAGSVSLATPLLKVPLEVSIQNLDFTEAEDFVTIRVLLNLGRGLTRFDGQLHPQPDLAASWKISKDATVYTFTLARKRWSDGQVITARDFVRGLRHTLSPETSAKIAVPLIQLIRGAGDFKAGRLKDFSKVGINAPDDHTLTFKLNHPASFFLSLLALPVAFPEPPETKDFKVKPGSPSSGSYVLKSLSPEKIVLAPNPLSSEPAANELEFVFVPESTTAVSLYEKKELDVVFRLPSSDFDRFKDSPELKKAPWLSTYYLGFNVTKAPFNEKALRKAIIQAVDRDGLNKIMKDTQKPSSSWIPTPLATSQFKYGPPYDPIGARKTWESVRDRPKQLELYFDAQEKNDLILAFIQGQLHDHLGVTVNLHSMEWKSYLRFLKTDAPPFFRFAWLAAFPDPLSHLGVFTTGNPNNHTGYSSPVYDKLVDEIARAPAGSRRRKLIKKAQEELLTEDMAILPLYHYVQYTLIRRNWRGLDLTPMGLLYFHNASVDRPGSSF